MPSSLLCLTLTVALLVPAWSRFQLQPGAFLKLPDKIGRHFFNNGAASKASYDPQENFLYVIGHKADVLHVINMTDPTTPQLLSTKTFDSLNIGLPDTVKVCRGGINREFLAVSFESLGQLEKSHVHLFQLLDSSTVNSGLTELKTPATLEGFDPKGLAWKTDCSELVAISEGDPHEINGFFTDPPGTIDILIPSFGTNIDKISLPIIEEHLEAAKVRQVFERCEASGDSTDTSSRAQDLEPHAVTVDKNNMAYIVFQENNAIGKLNLTDQFSNIVYHNLGRKDWSGLTFDASYDDGGMNLKSRILQSFYQPGDLVSFQVGGKVLLATADTGSIRKYSLSTCHFDESSDARGWNQPFSSALSPEDRTQLEADMNNNVEIGRLRVSKIRRVSDGWNAIQDGYDFVSTFGGRGFSILDPADMSRVYDSGDDFERYFTTADATEPQKAMFNAKVGSVNSPQSSLVDRESPVLGPAPSAITAVYINDTTQVLVIANGVVGGLYTYSVTTGPVVNFEGFLRRGQAGLTWNDAYARSDDAVGEPYITDLLSFEDQGQKTVVAVSSQAGAISVYSLVETA